MSVVSSLSVGAWVTAIALVFGALAMSIVARRIRQPLLATVAALPVVVAVLAIAFGIGLPAPAHALHVLLALGFAGLGVVAGSPLTALVLRLASNGQAEDGRFGGILITENGERTPREVLRGGAWIGYLERLAIVAAIAVGHPEAIAGVIAVKGLGRFSELDSAPARERFIIGTLTSMIWAAVCAAIIVLPGGALS
ncbi:hypothetical protein ACFPJ4_04025 [Lysinimonas soli]|uniref:Uncharacterized protein n=1 Tax=Lysinimonas soli TaxID=1074233 RepID=A0ABW0NN91_9MICO